MSVVGCVIRARIVEYVGSAAIVIWGVQAYMKEVKYSFPRLFLLGVFRNEP